MLVTVMLPVGVAVAVGLPVAVAVLVAVGVGVAVAVGVGVGVGAAVSDDQLPHWVRAESAHLCPPPCHMDAFISIHS